MKNLATELFDIETERPIETGLFRFGLGLLAYETIGGTYLFFVDELNMFDMMTLFGHIACGFLFAIPCIMFLIRSTQYRRIFAQALYSTVLIATSVVMLYTFFSGIILTFVGVTKHRLFWWSHIIASALTVLGFLYYITRTVTLVLDNSRLQLRTILRKKIWPVSYQVVGVCGTILLATGMSVYLHTEPPKFKDRAAFGGAYALTREKNFGSNWGVGSTVVTEDGKILNEEYFVNSKSCGRSGCHPDIFDQWKDSIHYRTPNPVFRGPETALMERERLAANGKVPLCGGCHMPVEFVAGIVKTGERRKSFDEFEGVSCIYCHAIQSVTKMKGERNWAFLEPPSRYPFAFSDSPLGTFINSTLINAKPEFHKKTYMKDLYKEVDFCTACHKKLVYTSWSNSVYNDRKHPEDRKICSDCHMKRVAVSDDISADEEGTVADHRYLAGNVFIPGLYGLDEMVALQEEFMKDEKIALSILAPDEVVPGSKVRFAVRMANIGVGHTYPAGASADIVESWLEVRLIDDENRTVMQYGTTDAEGDLDEDATYIYRIAPFDANGDPLGYTVHHSWLFRSHEEFVIHPKEFDEYDFEFDLAELRTNKISIEAVARYRSVSKAFADFYYGGEKKVRITDVATQSFEIAVKEALTSDERPVYSKNGAEIEEGLRKSAFVLPPGFKLTKTEPRDEDGLASTETAAITEKLEASLGR
ncbi:MAG: hypothetical protein CME06_11295 [Gemmatimonadetes bacterium]|nr:hypothetical protein [Gemmatimonadota bacterium]